MKRWTILLLILCLLTGCAAAPVESASPAEPPASTDPSPTPAPAAPAEIAPEEKPCTLTLDMVERADSVQGEDGTELAEYRLSLPRLTARRGDGTAIETAETEAETRALAAAETFNGQFAAWAGQEPLQELEKMAREEWDFRQEADIPWTAALTEELECQVYQTERLVSVAGTYYSYTGGAHPNTVLTAWNFDLERGDFFAPEQLAEDSEVFSQAVYREILRQIDCWAGENGMEAEDLFWSNYEEIAADWSSYAVSFDETGMTVAFSPYELAAYAAGSQVFRMDYGFLDPLLSDEGRALLGLAEE